MRMWTFSCVFRPLCWGFIWVHPRQCETNNDSERALQLVAWQAVQERGTGRSCLFSAWFSLERITVIILQDNNIMWELTRTCCFALPKKSLACFLQLSYPFRIQWKQIKTSAVQFGAKVLDAWKDAPAEVFHLIGNHELYNFNRPGWGWKHPETKGQDFIAVIANSKAAFLRALE